MLAALFLTAIWLDRSQPAQAPAETYTLLVVYVLFAAALTIAVWRDWWLDARLAGFAHLIDIGMFTAVVFSTNGYTSPFFLFFVFLLLSAAIRWGRRETALTALALIVLYLTAGLLVAHAEDFELQRFIIRSGHLVILSAILIWFGVNQRFAASAFELDDFLAVEPDIDAAELALRHGMEAAGARRGLLLLRTGNGEPFSGFRLAGGRLERAALPGPLLYDRAFSTAALFNLAKDRALAMTARSRKRFWRARTMLDVRAAAELGLTEGLICSVRSGRGEGWLVLQDIPALSTDYLELGLELGRACAMLLERHALIAAIEDGAEARARLSLARDLHDSVLQFFAGAAFRVEAIIRGTRAGSGVRSALEELKRLLVDEQRDLRGYIFALKESRSLDMAESVSELRVLAARLARQWSIACNVASDGADGSIPVKLHVDAQQIVREAVANAVRHGRADQVDITFSRDGETVRLELNDNGAGFPAEVGAVGQPRSLSARVKDANGTIEVASGRTGTSISVCLPIAGAVA